MFRPSLTLIALAVSAPSFANDAQKDMERIIVSGSRVIESIDEVPASITVISRKQIEDYALRAQDVEGGQGTLSFQCGLL